MSEREPWNKPRPRGAAKKLAAAQKAARQGRAARAGRRYPNLVDNMWAAGRRSARWRARQLRSRVRGGRGAAARH